MKVATGEFSADGRWDHAFLHRFQPWSPSCECRVGDASSEVVLPGLLARGRVSVEAALATAARRPYAIVVSANAQPVARARLGGGYGAIAFSAVTDAAGTLRIRFEPEGPAAESGFRLSWVRVSHEAGGHVPPGRWLQYALLTVVLLGLIGWSSGPRAALASLPLFMMVLALALAAARLHALAYLPWAIGIGAACAVLAVVASRCRLMTSAARWVVLGFALRAAFALHPACPAIDASFHVHRVWAFRQGQLLSGRAPGPEAQPLAVPYPPLLYALLAPIFPAASPHEELLLRAAMALLEGTAPLLVFALMRAGGASREAASHGAAAAAVMPEGVLVLGKGIAANILGQWLTVGIVAVLLRGASLPLTTAVLAVGLLGHFGAALCLLGLLAVWSVQRGPERPRLMAAITAALAFDWLVYYREVTPLIAGALVSIGGHLAGDPKQFLHVRWVRVGKTLQDLLLKFGATPLLLAAAGWRRADLPPRLAVLLKSWFLSGAAYGLLAWLTPLPLRFEYFLLPAVAAAAGLGAEEMRRRGRVGAVTAALALAFLLQAGLAVLMLAGRFEPISVILESDVWPFPLRAVPAPLIR